MAGAATRSFGARWDHADVGGILSWHGTPCNGAQIKRYLGGILMSAVFWAGTESNLGVCALKGFRRNLRRYLHSYLAFCNESNHPQTKKRIHLSQRSQQKTLSPNHTELSLPIPMYVRPQRLWGTATHAEPVDLMPRSPLQLPTPPDPPRRPLCMP